MPRSKKGSRKPSPRAKETQAAQSQAEARRKLSYRAYKFRRALGWSLVGLAILVGVSHWLEHLQAFSFASPGVQDLVAGYPMALLLGVAGAIVLSKT